MIASMFAALLFWASADSTRSPLGVDFEAGYQADLGSKRTDWYDVGARMEWRDQLLLDVAWSRPSGYDVPNLIMEWGRKPEPSRYGLRFCLGGKFDAAPAWLAAGVGWAFARLDTLDTLTDTRTILLEDGTDTDFKRTHWVWNNRVFRSAPYAMAEAGIGFGWLAFGLRTEYRFGWGMGGFVQIRFRRAGA